MSKKMVVRNPRFFGDQEYIIAKNILVIEDDEKLRKAMLELLRFEEYATDWSDSGLDGLKKVNSDAPDLIICDTHSPQIDSYAILKHLKNNPSLADIFVIVITSKEATVDDQARAEFSNIVYLEKPFQAAEFLRTVRVCFIN